MSFYQHLKERAFSGRCLTRMSTANRIVQYLVNKASQLSTCSPKTIVHEEEVATHLLEILESMLTCDSYTHKHETTLDYTTSDLKLERCEADPDDCYEELNYEEKEIVLEIKVFEDFSLSYMKWCLGFDGAINPKTGKRKHTWMSVKQHFRRTPYQYYMAPFRKCFEEATTNEKIDSIVIRSHSYAVVTATKFYVSIISLSNIICIDQR